MSSIPGYSLEAFLSWQWDLLVEGHDDANESLMVVRMITGHEKRLKLSTTSFAPLVALYEPWRENIEDSLLDFDEDEQSWRGYSEHVDSMVPEVVQHQAQEFVNLLKRDLQPISDPKPDIKVMIGPHLGGKSSVLIQRLTEHLAKLPGMTLIRNHEDIKHPLDRIMEMHGEMYNSIERQLYPLDLDKGLPKNQRVPHLKRGDKRNYPTRKK